MGKAKPIGGQLSKKLRVTHPTGVVLAEAWVLNDATIDLEILEVFLIMRDTINKRCLENGPRAKVEICEDVAAGALWEEVTAAALHSRYGEKVLPT